MTEDAEFYKWKGIIERTPEYYATKNDLIVANVPQHLWERLATVCEPVKQALEEKDKKLTFKQMYEQIMDLLGEYIDTSIENKTLISLWIIGSYLHKEFETYPYLFLNAMKGSGKTRALKLITKLAGGEILLSTTEASLFRTKGTIAIDEFESIGNKEKQALRELLNSGYKKGIKIIRMRKNFDKEGEKQVAEYFEPYRPIVMANINGMDEVLDDRCISLILEKSDNPRFTKIIEDFETNVNINKLKFCLCSYVSLRKVYNVTNWNEYVKHNNYTNIINTINYTNTTNIITPEDYYEEKEFFQKLFESNIDGRHLELYFPLLQIANIIEAPLLDVVIKIAKDKIKQKKDDEYGESRDVTLYSLVSNLNENEFYSTKDLVNTFNLMVGGGNNEWLNAKWIGRALKRLVLIVDKKKMSDGVYYRLDVAKAKQKVVMFT